MVGRFSFLFDDGLFSGAILVLGRGPPPMKKAAAEISGPGGCTGGPIWVEDFNRRITKMLIVVVMVKASSEQWT